jgi:dTMP kinase
VKSFLIAIEGTDGSGKETQTRLLFKNLRTKRIPALMLEFPMYSSLTGKLVKQYLHGEFGDLDPRAAALLYAGNRLEYKDKIVQSLKQGKIVILNRYVGSNQIHQAVRVKTEDRKRFLNWIEGLEYKSFGLPKPDMTIFLAVPPKFSIHLIKKRGREVDILEADKIHQNRAYRQALDVAKDRKWTVINCLKNNRLLSITKISKLILTKINARLRNRN